MNRCWNHEYEQARKPCGIHPRGEGWYSCVNGFEFERAERDRARWRMESNERCPRRPPYVPRPAFPGMQRVAIVGRSSLLTLMAMTAALAPGGFNVDED